MHARTWPCAALAVLVLSAAAVPAAAQPQLPPGFQATAVTPLQSPGTLAPLPDGRMLVTERITGRVRVIRDGVLLPPPFADVAVNWCGERGALGICPDPDFAQNGWVYLFYSLSSTGGDTSERDSVIDNRVVRFTAEGDSAAPGSETLIRSFPIGSPCAHQGGNLHFGPDDTLFVTLGDGNLGMELPLDLSDHRGKILRLDPTTGQAAPGNFFARDGDPTTMGEIWAYGLRNSFDFAVAAGGRALYATENGTDRDDEINFIVEQGDYGWPQVAGLADTPEEQSYAAEHPDYRDPIWASGDSVVCPTGVVVLDGTHWGGRYPPSLLVAECLAVGGSRRIVRYPLAPGDSTLGAAEVFGHGFGLITDLAFDPAGRLWVCTFHTIWRIDFDGFTAAQPGPGAELELAVVGPQPARGRVRVRYRLASGPGRLTVHDARGRHLSSIAEELPGGGRGEVLWEARSGDGLPLRPGVYFLRLAAPAGVRTARLVLVR